MEDIVAHLQGVPTDIMNLKTAGQTQLYMAILKLAVLQVDVMKVQLIPTASRSALLKQTELRVVL